MSRDSRRARFALVAAGGIVASGLVVTGLVLMNGAAGFAHCTGTSASGWMVILLSALMIAAVALLLLDAPQRGADGGTAFSGQTCGTCGSRVMDDWRLCPFCGELTEERRGGPRTSR